jgi:N-methylhydantoinase A
MKRNVAPALHNGGRGTADRIGVDIGGTFTDLAFYDGASGEVRIAKAPTTPAALEEGVLTAVRQALADKDVAQARLFMHGTTVGLNALLERRGAPTGLLCTQGFRDTLEMRRADRDFMFDLFWQPPEPLVPRRLRLPVSGRVRADGAVIAPLDRSSVLDALARLQEAGVEAIAVCFINAYANPEHELDAESILREAGFTGAISLSHRLSREYREYERTSTTVIDAYIRGLSAEYLARVESGLRGVGFTGEILVTRSAGGAITASDFAERPFESIQSGPVAGVEGVAELCRIEDFPLAVAADVGGTSFDTALIVRGQPHVKHQGDVIGMPVQTPWVDVRSIGAGGGSIAYVDDGLLRVGPQSAGAQPGPACYGRGGTEPTVTDAACVLGMLGDGVLSDTLRLRTDLAQQAIERIAEPLRLSLNEAAQGVLTVAASAMAGAIKEITVGQGEDPRDAILVCFGGAGPLFACLLSRELGIGSAVVPPHAGNFSAWGMLGQDVTHHAARTLILVLAEDRIPELDRALAELFDELAASRTNGKLESDARRTVTLDLRYVGQDHTLSITLPESTGRVESSLESIRERFEEEYVRRFGVVLPEPLEVVTLRAASRVPIGRPPLRAPGAGDVAGERALVDAFSFTLGARVPFRSVDRAALTHDSPIAGPAIVFETTSTTYVDSGYRLSLTPTGSLLITREDPDA